MRDRWGFPDAPDFTMEQRFRRNTKGSAIPSDTRPVRILKIRKAFRLIQPEGIGVHLTDGFMMEPEASVSAIVVSHPEARYFNVH
ncbi:vitamin B12 dependent-methionine synthase activation domain-containing protein [Bacillus licheniformis]|nr:vitamin B12 dependent-methionine synthase activation domain-containing protein [Bacillus licheniformis]